MRHEFSYEVTEELSRAATRRFFAKVITWRVPVVVIIYFALVALLAATGYSRIIVGFFLGAISLLMIIVVAAYLYRRHLASGLLKTLSDHSATCVLDDERLVLRTAMGTTNLAWPLIQRVVRGNRVWLLYLAGQPIWLPAGPLDGEAGDFLVERVRASGGKVE